MKKRSIYQLKNDLSRINLDSKQSVKKKQETIAKQYEKNYIEYERLYNEQEREYKSSSSSMDWI